MLKVKDAPGLYRDPNSNAILNLDQDAFTEYKKHKKAAEEQKNRKAQMESRLNTLEKEVRELKTGMDKILEILTNGNHSS
jgi:hypothetical protein